MPDLQTTAEAGYDKVLFRQYRGILAPKNMPDENVEKLAAALKEAAESDKFKTAYLDKYSLVGDYKGPADFAKIISETETELSKVLKK
jgi:tripartite-type tricarboxylate transporter receptor subunit TctC